MGLSLHTATLPKHFACARLCLCIGVKVAMHVCPLSARDGARGGVVVCDDDKNEVCWRRWAMAVMVVARHVFVAATAVGAPRVRPPPTPPLYGFPLLHAVPLFRSDTWREHTSDTLWRDGRGALSLFFGCAHRSVVPLVSPVGLFCLSDLPTACGADTHTMKWVRMHSQTMPSYSFRFYCSFPSLASIRRIVEHEGVSFLRPRFCSSLLC